AVLYIDATQVARGSAGFKVIEEFVTNGRDVPPIVLAGDAATLQGFESELPSAMRTSSKIDPLTPAQQVERVKRLAAQDGFILAQGVTDLLEVKLKGGGYEQAGEAWAALKQAQFARQFAEAAAVAAQGADAKAAPPSVISVREISVVDVGAMKVT